MVSIPPAPPTPDNSPPSTSSQHPVFFIPEQVASLRTRYPTKPPVSITVGLCPCPQTCDLMWLLAPRPLRPPPPSAPGRRRTIDDHAYSYSPCQSPVRRGLTVPRECQLVRPAEVTEEMVPFLTHPHATPQVSVIPRAAADDAACAFCRPDPVLHGVAALCAFHMYYLAGCRRVEDLRVLDGCRDRTTGRFACDGARVEKFRNLLVGSVAEPSRSDAEAAGLERDFGPIGTRPLSLSQESTSDGEPLGTPDAEQSNFDPRLASDEPDISELLELCDFAEGLPKPGPREEGKQPDCQETRNDEATSSRPR
ncbi:hypothetical protein F4804DRAFT_353579 [Jackrogersella minutella]|nr:hypothetical protein F4804DRAFT_353579 [Jackrogersella minutella]